MPGMTIVTFSMLVSRSNSTAFSQMFFGTSFNSDISNWNVGNGENFHSMFDEAAEFNQDLSNWQVGRGVDFSAMFANTKFSQNIDCKCFSICTDIWKV